MYVMIDVMYKLLGSGNVFNSEFLKNYDYFGDHYRRHRFFCCCRFFDILETKYYIQR